MKIFELSIGREDYDRLWAARLTLVDCTVAIGSSPNSWLRVEIGAGYRVHYWGWFRKAIFGETALEMLLRRYAPGWMDK